MNKEQKKTTKQFLTTLRAEFRKLDRMWYCYICKKALPSSPYCTEKHFQEKHPSVKPVEIGEGCFYNWNCRYPWNEKRIISLINNCARRKR